MTTVATITEHADAEGVTYHAVAGNRESTGKTAGKALDALTAQLTPEESGTIFIVQNLHQDRFFTATQDQRIADLMSRWLSARDTGTTLPDEEEAELEALAEAALQGARQRIDDLLSKLHP